MPKPLQILSPLHRATRQISLHMGDAMKEVDAKGPECHLLSYLRSCAPCPIGELGRVFGWKRSTLTSMLDRLERRGLLERELDPGDRRSFLVRLTGTGKSAADEVNRIVHRFEREVLKHVRQRDLAGFEAVMAVIANVTSVDVRPKSHAKTPAKAQEKR